MSEQGTIEVVYADRGDDGAKSFGAGRMMPRVGEVDTERLSESLRRLCAQTIDLFGDVDRAGGAFELSSVQLTVEVSGSGEVRLIGAVSMEVTGGIALTFTRRPTEPPPVVPAAS